VRFGVLGPLTVAADDGTPIDVPRPAVRATLAALLLLSATGSGASTPRAQLIEAIWGAHPPPGADGALRVRISGVRRALTGRLEIVTGALGYRIMLAGSELDADEFRTLTTRGRQSLDDGYPREAATLLTRACALWREPLLADVPDTPPLRAISATLLDRRQQAGEWLVDARLSLGHHYELLSEIRAAVATDPLSEHQYVQLMLALYRCGHKAAALDAYSRLREMTAREFGLDPGPEAREMLRRILADAEDLQFRPRLLATVTRGA